MISMTTAHRVFSELQKNKKFKDDITLHPLVPLLLKIGRYKMQTAECRLGMKCRLIQKMTFDIYGILYPVLIYVTPIKYKEEEIA